MHTFNPMAIVREMELSDPVSSEHGLEVTLFSKSMTPPNQYLQLALDSRYNLMMAMLYCCQIS